MAGPGISLQDLIDRFQLSPCQLDKEISEEHLGEVSDIIADHRILGPRLGLTDQEMTAIDENKRTHELKKEATLRKWKQKYDYMATYRKFIEVLLRCSRADHARQVCELLKKQGVSSERPSHRRRHSAALSTSPLTHNGANSPEYEELQPPAKCMKPDRALGSERIGSLTFSSHAARGFLSEEEVETKVNDFSKRFNKMALDTLDELEKGKVNPKRVILLFNLPSAYLQTRNEHVKFLDTLNAAADLLDLFSILSRYWDHFNYDLLKRLITAPCIERFIDCERCSQLQRDMKEYICEMGEFRQQTTIGVYWKIFVKKRKKKKEKVPEDFEELVRNKEEWSVMNTLQDVEDFRQEVAEEYQLHECLVFFKYILFGSVIIILWIPIVSPLPSTGPWPQGSYAAKEHVITKESGHEFPRNTVIDITVLFYSKRLPFKVDYMVTVQWLKNNLHEKRLVSLLPEDQCIHLHRGRSLSNEQQLQEYGIQQGSEVEVHHIKDHLVDHSMLDGGTSPVAIQPSSIPEKRLVSTSAEFKDHFNTEPSETFGELKGHLYKKRMTSIPSELLYLLFQSKTLGSDNRMEIYGTQNYSTVAVPKEHRETAIPLKDRTEKGHTREIITYLYQFANLFRELVSCQPKIGNMLVQLLQHWLQKSGMDTTVLQDILDDRDENPSFTIAAKTFKKERKKMEYLFITDDILFDKSDLVKFSFALELINIRKISFQKKNKYAVSQLLESLKTSKSLNTDYDMAFDCLSEGEIFEEAVEQNAYYLQSTRIQLTTNEEPIHYDKHMVRDSMRHAPSLVNKEYKEQPLGPRDLKQQITISQIGG